MPRNELRATKRIPVLIPITVRDARNLTIAGEICDVSVGGACIFATLVPSVGIEVQLGLNFGAMKLICNDPVDISETGIKIPEGSSELATVRWTRDHSCFGVKFTRLSVTSWQFITRLVSFYEQVIG